MIIQTTPGIWNGHWRVLGIPKGQPRPRAFVRGGRAAVYDPHTAEGWKSQIAVTLASMEGKLLEGPVALAITFIMPRPKSHYRTNGQLKPSVPEYHTTKFDIDNLAKAVMDCLTSIRVWKDDAQVCRLFLLREWENNDEPPGAKISICLLAEH